MKAKFHWKDGRIEEKEVPVNRVNVPPTIIQFPRNPTRHMAESFLSLEPNVDFLVTFERVEWNDGTYTYREQ